MRVKSLCDYCTYIGKLTLSYMEKSYYYKNESRFFLYNRKERFHMELDNAIFIAKSSRQNSYAPHSNYFVGAALKCKSGKIYSGCNIENDGIMSICAERVAFTKAISEGEKSFDYMIVCGGPTLDKLDDCLPCGYCRQFINEFVDKDFKIYALSENDNITEYSMEDLLPHSFKL